jgi:hypothetical protein
VVESLPCKLKVLSSNLSMAKERGGSKERERERERKREREREESMM